MEFARSVSNPFHYKYLLLFLDIALRNVVALFIFTFLFMSIRNNMLNLLLIFLLILLLFFFFFNNWIQGLGINFLNFLLDFLVVCAI